MAGWRNIIPSLMPFGAGSSGSTSVGWRNAAFHWLGFGVGGGGAAVADIHVHLFDYDIDSDGDYQVPARVGIDAFTVGGRVHNHGDTTLNVDGLDFQFVSNVMVTLTDVLPELIGPYAPDESVAFTVSVEPAAYGAWSFDLIVASDDPDTPVLTVTFEGMAYGTQVDIGWTAPNRRLEWTAPNRRLEWTAV